MKFLLLLSTLMFLPFGSVNAQEACTEIGCENGVIFDLAAKKDWAAGSYVVYATLDRKTYACKGELPLKPCEAGPSFVCSSPVLSVGESGCALPEQEQGLSRIKLNGSPRKVIVRITRDKEPVITKTLYPAYQTSRPNGPACGPVCSSASIDLFKK